MESIAEHEFMVTLARKRRRRYKVIFNCNFLQLRPVDPMDGKIVELESEGIVACRLMDEDEISAFELTHCNPKSLALRKFELQVSLTLEKYNKIPLTSLWESWDVDKK